VYSSLVIPAVKVPRHSVEPMQARVGTPCHGTGLQGAVAGGGGGLMGGAPPLPFGLLCVVRLPIGGHCAGGQSNMAWPTLESPNAQRALPTGSPALDACHTALHSNHAT
jgi:hypothetical protein